MTTEFVGSPDCPGSDELPAIPAKPGGSYLIPLKTTLETDAVEKTTTVFITAVPIKKASAALSLIRSLAPKDDESTSLQHLRRFAKYADVPMHVRDSHVVISPGSDILLILGPTAATSREFLLESLAPLLGDDVRVAAVEVPLRAPTSQEQAAAWTARYWPTIYKKNNPFGPHPSIVSRAEDEIRGDVDVWMELARQTARAARISGAGEAIGVVIVERRDGGAARPVAVAGDARWLDWPLEEAGGGEGNVAAHATMRAIAMVADRLRQAERESSGQQDDDDTAPQEDIFRSRAILPIEETPLQGSGSAMGDDGYLCHGLEIYCTHEPCVMCSMAIVHSRFAKAVFERRMDATGGLCADGELRHGLFWRKELNWTLLAWQWCRGALAVEGQEEDDLTVRRELNA